MPTSRLRASAVVPRRRAPRSAVPTERELVEALAGVLSGGADQGVLVVEHQPIVALPASAPIAVEALVRWDHPTWGRLPPDAFTSLAERSGLGGELDERVLHQALADMAAWEARGTRVNRVAVNLGRTSLLRPDLPDVLARACDVVGLAPARLAVEVLEHDHLPLPRVTPALAAVAATGATVVLDDFGSGCSGLGYLAALPAAVVKVDRGLLVAAAPPGPGADPALTARSAALLTGVVALARCVGAEVTIEGVETPAQHDTAVRSGAQHAQGWRYARALPAARVPAAFAARH